jgi:GTPase Era involved in 16S rRNA processing
MNENPSRITVQQIAARSHDARSRALAALFSRADPVIEATLGSASTLLGRLRVLEQRLDQERLQIAVLGQFKRGKSTFINALLGADLLPTGVIPLTAVATFIAWRHDPLVIVHFKGDRRNEEYTASTADAIRQVLFRFVAEEANPKNHLGVERVELFYPAGILANGTVLIDTPGIGSTLKHNTQAAMQVLSECDAAFFVLSADPPITEIELDYLLGLKARTPRVFFILNKADSLTPNEQGAAVEFLRKVLDEHALIDASESILRISARRGLVAKREGNNESLETSGIPAVEDHLLNALAREKHRWLEDAVRNKAVDVLTQADAELQLRVRALNIPLEDLAAKSDEFREVLASIGEQRRITRDLLAGDHRRLREALDARISELRTAVGTKLAAVINASLAGAVPKSWEEDARRSLSAAMEEEFDKAREPVVSAFAADAGAALRSYQERIQGLVNRVRQTAAQIFDVALGPDRERVEFQLGEDPYWITESIGGSLIPDPSRLVDHLLPGGLRRSRLRGRMMRQAEQLIVRNAENLRWAILRGLDETFRKAAAQLEEQLDQTVKGTRDIIGEALERRRERSSSVAPELDRLAAAAATLASLRHEFGGEQLP